MATWTSLDDIERALITYLNGETKEVLVDVIVINPDGLPLWLTYLDEEDREVVVMFTVIQGLTIVSRLTHVNGREVLS